MACWSIRCRRASGQMYYYFVYAKYLIQADPAGPEDRASSGQAGILENLISLVINAVYNGVKSVAGRKD